MAWNLNEIIARALDRASANSTNTNLPTATCTRMVNQALDEVSLEADWPWLRTVETLTTAAGASILQNATQAGSKNFLRTVDLVDTSNGQALTRRKVAILDRVIWSGRPQLYSVGGQIITVKPIPDGVYTLQHRYVQAEADLVNGTDVPLVPEIYGRGVVLYTANLMAIKISQPNTAAACAADYQAWVKRARGHINQGREPLRVEPRPGGWV